MKWMDERMNQRHQRIFLLVGLLLFGAASVYATGKSAKAAENPAYTLTKGKKVTILNIIQKKPLTTANKKKYANLK